MYAPTCSCASCILDKYFSRCVSRCNLVIPIDSIGSSLGQHGFLCCFPSAYLVLLSVSDKEKKGLERVVLSPDG